MSDQQPPKDIKDALSALYIDENQPKESYAFWGTQPVAQFNESGNAIKVGCWNDEGNSCLIFKNL